MTDYNNILLQLNDLQSRISKQDATILALTSKLERGHTNVAPMRISVPLDGRPLRGPRNGDRVPRGDRGDRVPRGPRIPRDNRERSTPHPTLTLLDVIKPNEEVTIQIKTGINNNGVQEYTTALTVFDGVNLEVVECDLANSLIGMKSSKPGEILYRFMEELKEGGHIKNTFGIAPWRLCFVERNGIRVSLEELRTTVG